MIGKKSGLRPLAAAAFLNLCAGSLYASSLLLAELQEVGVLTRQTAAAGFSLSTLAFLVGVLVAPAALRRYGGPRSTIAASIISASALGLAGARLLQLPPAALATTWAFFGLACGLFYAIAISTAKSCATNLPGLVTGVTVGAFAAGSVLWSFAGAASIARAGASGYLILLALAFLSATACAAAVPRIRAESAAMVPAPEQIAKILCTIWPLWVAFFCLSAAGLVLIGHSSQLATSVGLSATLLTAAIGVANGVGRLGGGAVTDRIGIRVVIVALSLMMSCALLVAATSRNAAPLALAIVVAGLIYGAASAAFPALLMRQTSVERFPRRFAILFAAWGAAGLTAPLMAGMSTAVSGYGTALLALAALNVCAAVVAIRQPVG